MLQDAFNRYGKLIHSVTKSHKKPGRIAQNTIESIEVLVYNCENVTSDGMNEAYVLSANEGHVSITSESEWGIMNGLESFVQLIHDIDGYSAVNTTFISDFPRFAFRGMLIDTSRHYLPISVIKVRAEDIATY